MVFDIVQALSPMTVALGFASLALFIIIIIIITRMAIPAS